jgi:hypothetical protein
MKIGDHVMLTERMAAAIEKTRAAHGHLPLGWKERRGIIKRVRKPGGIFGVMWEGRRTLDWLAPKALRLENGHAATDVLGKAAAP